MKSKLPFANLNVKPGVRRKRNVDTLTAWRTNSRVTDYLIEHIPPVLWSATVPGVPSRTIRAVAALSTTHGAPGSRPWAVSMGSSPLYGRITGP